jgi:hypothetical protein
MVHCVIERYNTFTLVNKGDARRYWLMKSLNTLVSIVMFVLIIFYIVYLSIVMINNYVVPTSLRAFGDIIWLVMVFIIIFFLVICVISELTLNALMIRYVFKVQAAALSYTENPKSGRTQISTGRRIIWKLIALASLDVIVFVVRFVVLNGSQNVQALPFFSVACWVEAFAGDFYVILHYVLVTRLLDEFKTAALTKPASVADSLNAPTNAQKSSIKASNDVGTNSDGVAMSRV